MAMLAHELRNPLAPIRACLYILDHAPKGGEEARRAQAIIERQIVHLTRLVDDLLDASRIDRRAVVLQRERLDLCELVRITAEDHRRAFVEGLIELEVSTARVEAWVKGDRVRLAQVVGNLLGNSVKFTEPGGRTTVTVEADAARGQAVVRVQDTGRGIAPDMLTRIFDPFTQVDVTLDRKKGGLGLGLSLVKGLVEMHDGAVDAASEGPGTGATFTIRLPLETVAPVESRPRKEEAHINRGSRRVLVIEDNADAADSIGRALTMVGHAVEVARSGPEGIERAHAFVPEIVLCDIGLPEMDGYDVARAMRADPTLGRVTLVALTGYAGPDDIARAKAAGFDAHLAKPPTMATLERALQAR
jgi:two-component system CheB/CheR fusion protein